MSQLLNDEVQGQIKDLLKDMKDPITMVLFTKEEPCQTCKETKQLLSEVKSLNDKITIVEKDLNDDAEDAKKYGITLTPSFVILDKDNTYTGVKFNGIPAGHEINSFLSAIVYMSGVTITYDEKTLEAIKNIDKNIDIKVFVTLSCPHCPGAVQTAHQIAMLNKNVEASMVEAQTFPELSNQFKVSGVPKIIINDTVELVGNQPIDAFLREIKNL